MTPQQVFSSKFPKCLKGLKEYMIWLLSTRSNGWIDGGNSQVREKRHLVGEGQASSVEVFLYRGIPQYPSLMESIDVGLLGGGGVVGLVVSASIEGEKI